MSHPTQPTRLPHQPPRTLRQAWLALTGLSAVFLFEMLDGSILNVALPTIGRELHASTLALSWVTNAYAVALGGLMLVLGAVADRVGRRRVMIVGLVLLGLASLATAFVTNAGELIGVRAVMGLAAAMTTPGSMALAFRLFDDEALRVRAITLISTVGWSGSRSVRRPAASSWPSPRGRSCCSRTSRVAALASSASGSASPRTTPPPGTVPRSTSPGSARHRHDRPRPGRAHPVRRRGRALLGGVVGGGCDRARGGPLRPSRTVDRPPVARPGVVARPLVSGGLAYKPLPAWRSPGSATW